MLKKKSRYPNIRSFIVENRGTCDFEKVLHIVNLIDDDEATDKEILDALEEFLPSVSESFKFRVKLEESTKEILGNRYGWW